MPRYYFHISGSVTARDGVGRDLASPHDVRPAALMEAARMAAAHAQRNEEVTITVTACDLTGAAVLKVRLMSQVEGP